MRIAALLMAASAVWADPGAAVTVAGQAKQPQVAVDADGGVYVAMLREGNIEVSISTDRGKTFSAPSVAIDAKGAAKGGMQRGPRIAVDGKRGIYVTAPVALGGTESDLWLTVSRDGGKTWSAPLRVNDAPGKAPECLHWLAVSADGDAHVAWIDSRPMGAGPNSLAYARVTGGTKAEKSQQLAGPVCECCAPGVSVDAKGNPLVIYREGGKKSEREIYALISTNEGKSFGKPVRINKGDSKVDG